MGSIIYRTYFKILGFTLTELLISLLISIFLITVVLQLLQDMILLNKQHNMLYELQERSRTFVQEWLYDARKAGYFGCESIKRIEIPVPIPHAYDISYKNAMQFYNLQNTGEHRISLFEYIDYAQPVKRDFSIPSAIYYKTKEMKSSFHKYDWIILSNCEILKIQKIKGIKNKNGLVEIYLSNNIDKIFDTNYLEIGKIHEYEYYTSKNSDNKNLVYKKDILQNNNQNKLLTDGLSYFYFAKMSNIFNINFIFSSQDKWKHNLSCFNFMINNQNKKFYSYYFLTNYFVKLKNENLLRSLLSS